MTLQRPCARWRLLTARPSRSPPLLKRTRRKRCRQSLSVARRMQSARGSPASRNVTRTSRDGRGQRTKGPPGFPKEILNQTFQTPKSSLRSDAALGIFAICAYFRRNRSEVVAHRKATKSPSHPARRRASSKFRGLRKSREAARAMMANSWRGFGKPSWMAERAELAPQRLSVRVSPR